MKEVTFRKLMDHVGDRGVVREFYGDIDEVDGKIVLRNSIGRIVYRLVDGDEINVGIAPEEGSERGYRMKQYRVSL